MGPPGLLWGGPLWPPLDSYRLGPYGPGPYGLPRALMNRARMGQARVPSLGPYGTPWNA